MAKNKSSEQHSHGLEESVNRAEAFYRNNSKAINVVCIAIIIVIGGYFGYKYLYQKPREKKAVEMVYRAQHYFAVDSFQLALNGDGNNYGYLKVIDRYGNTKVGNQAKYAAGACYIHLGQFQKGINYLKKFKADDKIVQAISYGLMGDAYMELGQNEKGIKYYKKAGHYNENKLTAPLYLMRAGLALEKEGKSSEAIQIFKTIKQKYPQSSQGKNIDKYLARLGIVSEE